MSDLTGLKDTFNIMRRARDRGRFNTSEYKESTLASGIRGRFTVKTGEGSTKEEGFGGPKRWNVICEPLAVTPRRGDFLVWSAVYYKVASEKAEYDHNGNYHHHRFVVEDANG